MALPELTAPAGLPYFLAEGHAIELLPVFATVERTSGHVRRRRMWTAAPRVQSVGWVLTSEQMAEVHRWYRDDLQMGSRRFSALVASEGGTLVWFEAMWAEPFTASAMHRGRWRVTGRLRLLGEPDLGSGGTGPVRTTFRATVWLDVGGAAVMQVGRPMSAALEVDVDGGAVMATVPLLAAEVTVPIGGSAVMTTGGA